jgi:hypothetical protein
MWTGKQAETDRIDEINSRFRNFSNGPRNESTVKDKSYTQSHVVMRMYQSSRPATERASIVPNFLSGAAYNLTAYATVWVCSVWNTFAPTHF